MIAGLVEEPDMSPSPSPYLLSGSLSGPPPPRYTYATIVGRAGECRSEQVDLPF